MPISVKRTGVALGVGAALALAANAAQAVLVYTVDTTNPASIPGLSSFSTTGAEMVGMEVEVVFGSSTGNTLAQTRSWQATGADSGGATGDGWSLSLSGNSYSSSWTFTIGNQNLGQLKYLELRGAPGLTVFDRTPADINDSATWGTPGSAQGADFEFLTGFDPSAFDGSVTVRYSIPVRIGATDFVGDLFHVVSVDFSTEAGAVLGPRTSFTFRQDTDNDSRITNVPEPGVLALLGVGLAGLAASRRRRL